MTDAPDLVALWRQAYEAEKARREAVEAELARVKAAGHGGEASAKDLPDSVRAVVARYSFGDPGLQARTLTYARTQLAAGAKTDELVAAIEGGGYHPEVEDDDA